MNIIIGLGVGASVIIATCYFDRIIECCKGKRKVHTDHLAEKNDLNLLTRTIHQSNSIPQTPIIDDSSSQTSPSSSETPKILTAQATIDANDTDPITQSSGALIEYIAKLANKSISSVTMDTSTLEAIIKDFHYTNLARSRGIQCAFQSLTLVEIRRINFLRWHVKDFHTPTQKNQSLLSRLKVQLHSMSQFYTEPEMQKWQNTINNIIKAIEELENLLIVPSAPQKDDTALLEYLITVNKRSFKGPITTNNPCPPIQEIYEALHYINAARTIWGISVHYTIQENYRTNYLTLNLCEMEMKIVSYLRTWGIDDSYKSKENSLLLAEIKKSLTIMLRYYHGNDEYYLLSIKALLSDRFFGSSQ